MRPETAMEIGYAVGTYRDDTLRISRAEVAPLDATQAQLALYAGEAGEVVDEIKKHLFHAKPLDPAAIVLELGDVLWYVDRLLMMLGSSIPEALAENLAKLQARYPDGWDAADKHYDHDTEAGS